MNEELLAPVTVEEVKAPGPDGFPGLFYLKYWRIVNDIVSETAKDLFAGRVGLNNLNMTHIVLFPKVEISEKTTQFRPISLCNNSYKIVVVNGRSIRIWHDSWIPPPSLGGGILIDGALPPLSPQLVHSLMDWDTHTWRLNGVANVLNQEAKDRIRCIPIGEEDGIDRLLWLWSKNGSFTVKSSYHWLHQQSSLNASHPVITGSSHRVEIAEAEATLLGASTAASNRWRKVVLESDSQTIIEECRNRKNRN
ncbi:hypothetical protein ACLB2K_040113 [Fragaria x ananassa]